MILDLIAAWCGIQRAKNYAEKPFVCPNCGEIFSVRWQNLWWYRNYTLIMNGKAKLKCPKCKVSDMCRWTGEER